MKKFFFFVGLLSSLFFLPMRAISRGDVLKLGSAGLITWDVADLLRGKHTKENISTRSFYKSYIGIATLATLYLHSKLKRGLNPSVEGITFHERFSQHKNKHFWYNCFTLPFFDSHGNFLNLHRTPCREPQKNVISKSCFAQHGNTCGFCSLYNAICFYSNNINDMTNQQKFEIFCREIQACLDKHPKESMVIENEHGYTNEDNLEMFINKCHFCKPIRRKKPEILNKKYATTKEDYIYNYLKDDISIISDIDGLSNMLQNPSQFREVIKSGYYNHTIKNIINFQNNTAPCQIIIVNETTKWNEGLHWFVVALQGSKIFYADSLGIDRSHRLHTRNTGLNRGTLEKVYSLFHTKIETNLIR